MDVPTLHPPQKAWVKRLGKRFASHKSVLGCAPTGFGKTVALAHMAMKIAESGQSVMMTVHRQEIFLQTSIMLLNFNLPHKLIGSTEVVNMATLAAARRGEILYQHGQVVLASLPTLMRRGRVPKVDYLFVDEAHHAAAKTWAKVISHYRNAGTRILGVTATAERHDGKALCPLFESMVPGPSMKLLIGGGYLAPFEIKVPKAQIDRAGLHLVAGDYNTKELAPRARVVVGDAIEQYRKYMDGDKCLVFTPSVEEAEHTAAAFCEAGYRAASVDGRMKERERNQRIKSLGAHEIQLLMSCNVLSEGLDVPSVAGLIHLRPTYSRGRWVQDVGRSIRYEPGKVAIILDHAGNTAFHGSPLDIEDWAFAGRDQDGKRKGEPKDAATTLTNCSVCFMGFLSRLLVCPHCGSERVRQSLSYDKVEGELVDERRVDEPEILAAKEAAMLYRSAGMVNGELKNIAAKHSMSDEWTEMMRRRIECWDTPIFNQDLQTLVEAE